MTKGVLFPILLISGCVIAGLYGALHNQISYTVSPDYFQAFKFDQFNIPEDLRNRFGASLVGWYASWWMGLFIGVPVLLIGLIMPDGRTYLVNSVVAFAVVIATALVVGLGALANANNTITLLNLPSYCCPDGVDKVAFARAGAMHNASYAGGFLGIVTGSSYQITARVYLAWRSSRRRPSLV